jgi:hypothetical protein
MRVVSTGTLRRAAGPDRPRARERDRTRGGAATGVTGSSRPPLPPSIQAAPPRSEPHKREKPPQRAASLLKDRRRPTLPGPCEPSTIGAAGLNFSVRNGKRCFPRAIATGNLSRPRLSGPSKLHNPANERAPRKKIRQALDPLVPVSYTCHHASRSGLSTWWSTRGLTLSRRWESSSQGRLPA